MKTNVSPIYRMRRLRQNESIRQLVQENLLSVSDLVQPLFIKSGYSIRIPIDSMPGQFQLSIDQLPSEVDSLVKFGIPAVMLFGIPSKKDVTGAVSLKPDGVVQQAIKSIKSQCRSLLVIADLCFCEYTDHGHCGVIAENSDGSKYVDNDATLEQLALQAVSLARAGADIVAPSGMMDGMVAAIRFALDSAGFQHVMILSYAVKYASAFYGPFREAAEGAPQFGDRRSYQMDPANGLEALREAELDVDEGADMLMVKPAMSYLDIVHSVKLANPSIPLAAYQVSGEYAMIKAAADHGWVDETSVMMESLISIKRAGADFIVTYFAKDAAQLLLS